ncbi:hypothetical protein FRC04_011988 [Tulasnella sp. 424]|nr:hypothetical protein FRC04_011988 [Tulasnella sp. 424]KAG8971312.1 hypothetical protein FRC05_011304 [Tulasnella sp. 425]
MAMIFGMLGQQDCAAAAVVCRHWSGVALDELWRSIPSLRPLFGLLGSLKRTELGYDLHPDVVLTAKSWDLFKSYGARVRHLACDDPSYDVGISSGLVMQALAVHPEGGILPNLRAAHWDVDGTGLSNVTAFCPPLLERMCLFIRPENASVDQVNRLLSDLSSSLANRLKSFEFGTNFTSYQDATMSTSLNAFLKTQRSLRQLRLPSYHIQDVATMSEVCQASPQLRTFCGEMRDLTSERLQLALNALARSGHSLRCIRLARSETHVPQETMGLADIEPLLQLSALEDVGLWLESKLHLDTQDIQRMGQAWRRVASLILYSDQGSQFDPCHLLTFAESFPALENLAAPFDCVGDIPNTNAVPSRFKSLRRLTLLDAHAPDGIIQPLAEFLARICGPEVTVVLSNYGPDSCQALECEFDWNRTWDQNWMTDAVRDWMARLYQAQEDFVCDAIGNLEWMEAFDNDFADEFRSAALIPWQTFNIGKISGKVKSASGGGFTAGKFTYIVVHEAGHMVPFHQPEAASDLFTRWLADAPLDPKLEN